MTSDLSQNELSRLNVELIFSPSVHTSKNEYGSSMVTTPY